MQIVSSCGYYVGVRVKFYMQNLLSVCGWPCAELSGFIKVDCIRLLYLFENLC